LEFLALPLIAEIGAALAGFATLVGVIRHDELDADAIFATVFNSLIAVVFAIVAILFLESSETAGQSIRFIAALLLATSVMVISREFNVYRLSWKDESKRPEVTGVGRFFGAATVVSMFVSPALTCVVVGGLFPMRAALLYEFAVFSHLLTAIFLLLFVVWRNFALRSNPPPVS
jgi:hypothetical protein